MINIIELLYDHLITTKPQIGGFKFIYGLDDTNCDQGYFIKVIDSNNIDISLRLEKLVIRTGCIFRTSLEGAELKISSDMYVTHKIKWYTFFNVTAIPVVPYRLGISYVTHHLDIEDPACIEQLLSILNEHFRTVINHELLGTIIRQLQVYKLRVEDDFV
jgi:hypothetical protein